MNVSLFKVFMCEEAGRAANKVLYSGYVGEGGKVVEFENTVSRALSLSYVLSLNTGTSGLHLAYHMAKREGRMKAILSPMTCMATAAPLVANGFELLWADVDPLSGNINPDDVERRLDSSVGVVVMMHWGGAPCDIGRFLELQGRYGFVLVEDAAHALGAQYGGRNVGLFSDFTMFSLQAIKHVTSVDGGLLVCKRHEDYERGKLLRWYGIDRDTKLDDMRCSVDVPEVGYKFHMNDMNAAIGLENFRHLDGILERCRSNAAFYDKAFAGSNVRVPRVSYTSRSSYWLYTVSVSNCDEMRRLLRSDGVESSKVHSRLDMHTAFNMQRMELLGVDAFARDHLCIPVGWWVLEEEREYVAERVLKYARS